MIYRSFLFAPGDSDRKIEKAIATNADAIILDLEDAVVAENRPTARTMVRNVLQNIGPTMPGRLWVRVNPVCTDDCLSDLAAITCDGLAGVMVPKPDSAADIDTVSAYLAALERKEGLASGTVKILSVMTETGKGFLNAASYGNAERPRLSGVLWGAEDLSAALGASANTDEDGALSFTYQMARSLCLAAASAGEIQAIDTVYTDFKNPDGLRANSLAARREGFLGKIAIHPNQVDIINECFSPSAADIAHAKAVIAAFAENPGKGTVGLNGKMLDRPHQVQAERILSLAEAFNIQ
ncbi:HpcH/HpaI aldolase/citrate lyase family protein [Zhongshania marina]|uniref:CoA ester lyase n=1 Tax=Zhongshania marina TaxID=2304603 RepID=A0A2S4HGM8_9GAMM|nr:CoA ester lyase [Marortus luteolus]POP52851.1 CoA ester lyase [Marortus luteolus]